VLSAVDLAVIAAVSCAVANAGAARIGVYAETMRSAVELALGAAVASGIAHAHAVITAAVSAAFPRNLAVVTGVAAMADALVAASDLAVLSAVNLTVVAAVLFGVAGARPVFIARAVRPAGHIAELPAVVLCACATGWIAHAAVFAVELAVLATIRDRAATDVAFANAAVLAHEFNLAEIAGEAAIVAHALVTITDRPVLPAVDLAALSGVLLAVAYAAAVLVN